MFQKTYTINIVLWVRDFGDLARNRRMEGRKVFSPHTMISVATSGERMAWAAAWGQGDTGAAASWRCGTAVQDRAGWEHRVLKAMGDPAGQAGCGDEYAAPLLL